MEEFLNRLDYQIPKLIIEKKLLKRNKSLLFRNWKGIYQRQTWLISIKSVLKYIILHLSWHVVTCINFLSTTAGLVVHYYTHLLSLTAAAVWALITRQILQLPRFAAGMNGTRIKLSIFHLFIGIFWKFKNSFNH